MKRFFDFPSHFVLLRRVLWWMLLIMPLAVMVGCASALFLTLLDKVTSARFMHPGILFLLPLCGLAVGLLHHWVGKPVEGGNNLILEQIHQPGGGVPKRMAPLILFSTLMTHLFGGSAGREGTAVQMGGSLASTYSKWFGISETDRRVLLMAGVAAGFGSVFGTPLTGAIFAIEVLVIGRLQYEAAVPILLASVLGDATCYWLGIRHHEAVIAFNGSVVHPLQAVLLGKVAIAGVAFGLAGLLFCELQHGFQHLFRRVMPWAPARPVVGAFVIIALVYMLGTRDYLGLSVSAPSLDGITLDKAFIPGGVDAWSWWWKLLFTAVTLASGFKGGEVTPLFFIGACLGNVIGWIVGAPVDLFAAIGFISVFAGCAHTPIAGTIMGMELFGAQYAVYFALACFLAHYFSGYSGIYLSQRLESAEGQGGVSLRDERKRRQGALARRMERLRQAAYESVHRDKNGRE